MEMGKTHSKQNMEEQEVKTSGSEKTEGVEKTAGWEEAINVVVQIIETEFSCCICNEIYIEPTVSGCGHTFCHHCISTWRKDNFDCPICRKNMLHLVKHVDMENFLNKFHTFVSPEVHQKRKEIIQERQVEIARERSNVERAVATVQNANAQAGGAARSSASGTHGLGNRMRSIMIRPHGRVNLMWPVIDFSHLLPPDRLVELSREREASASEEQSGQRGGPVFPPRRTTISHGNRPQPTVARSASRMTAVSTEELSDRERRMQRRTLRSAIANRVQEIEERVASERRISSGAQQGGSGSTAQIGPIRARRRGRPRRSTTNFSTAAQPSQSSVGSDQSVIVISSSPSAGASETEPVMEVVRPVVRRTPRMSLRGREPVSVPISRESGSSRSRSGPGRPRRADRAPRRQLEEIEID